ncbi:MAG: POTRA domain-containing protein [Bacteroidota bacterium]
MYKLPRTSRSQTFFLWILLVGCCVISSEGVAQAIPETKAASFSPLLPKLVIDSIRVEGNRRTHESIVLRELPFRMSDTCQLSQLVQWFEESKRALMNTTLFQQVTVFADTFIGDRVLVTVRVRERPNLYLALFFDPVDRNLNQWLVEQHASLRRVNYGTQLFLNNTSGVGDRSLLLLLGGYTQQVSFSYDRPYLDKRMRWGLRAGFSTGRNHEVNVKTVNDKQVFLRNADMFLRYSTQAFAELTHRPHINTRHTFGIQWRWDRVADTVSRVNANYFPSGQARVQFPRFYYALNFQRVDYVPYPRKGPLAQLQLIHSGLGSSMNLFEAHGKWMMHWPLNAKWGLAWGMYAGVKFPTHQPFVNRRFLGYGNQFLSGYEYYVVDGLAGGLTRGYLNREILRHTIYIPYQKGKAPIRIPIRLVGKSFVQAGYVHDPTAPMDSRLSNRFLYSGGVGIDLLLFYDVLFRLEYSVNRFGENGLFLHRKYPF